MSAATHETGGVYRERADNLHAELWEKYEDAYKNSDSWQFTCEKKGVIVMTKYYGEDSIPWCLGQGKIKGVSAMDVVEKVRYPEKRGEWDLFYEEGRVVEQIDDRTGVGWFKTKSQYTVWPRDFALLVNARDLLPDEHGKKGIVMVGASVVDDRVPEVEGCVRGNILNGGFVIEEKDEGVIVTYMFKIDVAGWVPSSIANMVTTYQPLSILGIRKLLQGNSDDPDA